MWSELLHQLRREDDGERRCISITIWHGNNSEGLWFCPKLAELNADIFFGCVNATVAQRLLCRAISLCLEKHNLAAVISDKEQSKVVKSTELAEIIQT